MSTLWCRGTRGGSILRRVRQSSADDARLDTWRPISWPGARSFGLASGGAAPKEEAERLAVDHRGCGAGRIVRDSCRRGLCRLQAATYPDGNGHGDCSADPNLYGDADLHTDGDGDPYACSHDHAYANGCAANGDGDLSGIGRAQDHLSGIRSRYRW